MTDWCVNNIKVQSKNKEKLKQLLDDIVDNDFNFNDIVPTPEDIVNNRDTNDKELKTNILNKYKIKSFEQWFLDNWGTISNSNDVELSDIRNENNLFVLYINFETAWRPPTEIIQTLGLKYHDLEFELIFAENVSDNVGSIKANSKKVQMTNYKNGDERYEEILNQLGF